MGTGTGTKFYPRVESWADMDNPCGYGRGRVFTLPDPNPTHCHAFRFVRISAPVRVTSKYYRVLELRRRAAVRRHGSPAVSSHLTQSMLDTIGWSAQES
jgi:hypothetical protein